MAWIALDAGDNDPAVFGAYLLAASAMENTAAIFAREADLIADAKLMKVGKRLAVGEVTILSDGSDEPVAHVTATYSIPAR